MASVTHLHHHPMPASSPTPRPGPPNSPARAARLETLASLQKERTGLIQEQMQLQEKLRALPHGAPEREAQVPRFEKVTQRLKELKALIAGKLPPPPATPQDEGPSVLSSLRSLRHWLLELVAKGVVLPTPEQLLLLDRARFLIERGPGRAQRADSSSAPPTPGALEALRVEQESSRDARQALAANQDAAKQAMVRIAQLESALEGSRAMRAKTEDVCRRLLAAEDDANPSQERYDKAMDEVVELARAAMDEAPTPTRPRPRVAPEGRGSASIRGGPGRQE